MLQFFNAFIVFLFLALLFWVLPEVFSVFSCDVLVCVRFVVFLIDYFGFAEGFVGILSGQHTFSDSFLASGRNLFLKKAGYCCDEPTSLHYPNDRRVRERFSCSHQIQ